VSEPLGVVAAIAPRNAPGLILCKASGLGRAGGQPRLDEYAELKTVIIYKSGDHI
jgi:acyl-CoA reductase-like NAD-dependent aldehyde dehydrogenase